ncbi:2-dehydropantoate 2-reductase [Bradyrhizobium sp. CB82]|uniref:ketopantoate reductase family protein n=1 Tax=Bradyrhizobium sp. CB82 TaxID=3039159 RepID=UPI0024B0F25B|nr:2-dehydropantoate 2-reductase [Bradyrhizobium sp. CB82]WFU43363.1 2-dehydropantoate 2-reductase [Bradyrhizobium sp. CB82]
MRIGVIGAGAMGCLFAGSLAEAEEDVFLIEVAQTQIETIRDRGLRLDTDCGSRVLHLPIGEAQMFSGPCDLLVVFTKSFHTRAAIRTAAPLLGSSGIAMTVQNGLGNAEAIAQVVPEDRIVVGMTTWPADIRASGHVVSHGSGEVRIWSMTRKPSDVVFKIARSLSCAGLNCIADPDVESAIWEKLAFNAALNSLCAASGLTVGSIGQSGTGRRLAGAIASETLAVARALSIKVNKDRVQKALDHAFLSHRDHKPRCFRTCSRDV